MDSVNVVQSMSKAKVLYRELIKLTHPDRNPQKRELAEEFTQQVNQARFDYHKLLCSLNKLLILYKLPF